MHPQSDALRVSMSCLSVYKGNRISTFYQSSKSHNKLMLPSEGTQTSTKPTRSTPQRVKRITWFIEEFKPYSSEVQVLSETRKTLTPKKSKRPILKISQLRVTGSSIRTDTPPAKPQSACSSPSSSFFSLHKTPAVPDVEFMRMKEQFHIKYEAASKQNFKNRKTKTRSLRKKFLYLRSPVLTVKESRLLYAKQRIRPSRSELFERVKGILLMEQNSDVLSQSGVQTMIQTGFSFKAPNPVRRSNQGRLIAAMLGTRSQSVEELHQQLSKLVDQMDNKIEKVINRHDDQFLTAYRAQMIKVQRELSYFKEKANEQEFALRKDERINTLQESLLWFRNQAIRLGEEKEEYKRQLSEFNSNSVEELTLKYEGLSDDKRFLEEQAKATKKQVKMLRNALERSQNIVKSFQGDESGLLPQIAMKYSSTSNYTTTDALPRQGQQHSSLQKRSLFTHRERNRSIAETTTETPKLPRIISHSPQDSLMMDFDYSKEGIDTLPPIDAPSSLPEDEALKKQKALGSASFMPGGGIPRHSHHQSIPGKLGGKLEIKKNSIETESEDARHTASVEPRRYEQGHPSPSMRYEVKEQEEDEEQINDIEENGEQIVEKENGESSEEKKEEEIQNEKIENEADKTDTMALLPEGDITEIPGTKLSAFVFQLIDAGIGRAEIVYEVDSYMRSEEQRVNTLLEQMRRTIDAKTNEIKKLKSQHNEQYYLRNQMEDIFFECVEQVRLDAFNRQQLNMAPLLTTRKKEEETKMQHRRMSSGQHFTADERRKIIEQFLNNDEIVQNIHRLLFKKTEENQLGKTDVFRTSNRYHSYADSEEPAAQTYMLDTRKMKSTKHSTSKSIGLEQQLVRIDSQDYNELMRNEKPPSKKSSQKMKLPQHSYKELQKLLGAKRGYILNHTVKDGQLMLKKV